MHTFAVIEPCKSINHSPIVIIVELFLSLLLSLKEFHISLYVHKALFSEELFLTEGGVWPFNS